MRVDECAGGRAHAGRADDGDVRSLGLVEQVADGAGLDARDVDAIWLEGESCREACALILRSGACQDLLEGPAEHLACGCNALIEHLVLVATVRQTHDELGGQSLRVGLELGGDVDARRCARVLLDDRIRCGGVIRSRLLRIRCRCERRREDDRSGGRHGHREDGLAHGSLFQSAGTQTRLPTKYMNVRANGSEILVILEQSLSKHD